MPTTAAVELRSDVPAANDLGAILRPRSIAVSAGLVEVGTDGARLQDELVDVCRETGMRLIGPNCIGVANTAPDMRLNGQFAPAERTRQAGAHRNLREAGGRGTSVAAAEGIRWA